MGKADKLNIYFPLNNLNPQGWISEFITPVLTKTGVMNRSMLSNLFYDKDLDSETVSHLRKKLGKVEYDSFINSRGSIEEEKMTFLNGNFLDILEVDATMRDSTLTEQELIEYTIFMSTIKPYQAAFLQSYMRLQYGYRLNQKEEFKWVDFPFTQVFDLEFILRNPQARSEGSGITDVTVNNKFNLGTQVNSEILINFTFGNMKVLTQEITESGIPVEKKNSSLPYGFSFMKLVGNLDTKKEVLRLEYGKKVAHGFESVTLTQNLKSIIERKEKKAILLHKLSHDFSFDEKGVIKLGIKCYNFHDISMLSPNNIAVPAHSSLLVATMDLAKEHGDILNTYGSLKKEIVLLEDQIKNVESESEAKTVDKVNSERKEVQVKFLSQKLAKTNKTLNLLGRSLKPNLTTALLDKVKAQGQLFGINFNTIKDGSVFKITTNIFIVNPTNGDFQNIHSELNNWDSNEYQTDTKIKDLYSSNPASTADILPRIFSRIFNSPYDESKKDDKTYGHLMFFPLKALISAGYSFLSEEEKSIIPHMLFGNVLMKVGSEVCSINIGDLLVETGVFQKWYYSKFYKKDRLEYSFGAFMSDIITDLVPEVLYRNRVGFDDKAPTTAIKQAQYYLENIIDEKLKKDIYVNGNNDDLKKLSKLLSKTPTSNPSPLIYYGQLNNPTMQIPSPLFSNLGVSEFKFDEIQDSRKGIPHIKIGADGGVFTSVNFKGHDFKLIRTALAMEALADKSSRYFFFHYQLGIEMLGNNLFNYDSVVCVPSNPLGIDSEENDPGIAGYYKVISTSDRLDSNNNYYTSAEADWVFNPRADDREREKAGKEPSLSIVINDRIKSSVNDPINYILELLENDANGIINSQLQNLPKPDKKPKEQAKKNKVEKAKRSNNNFDKIETFKATQMPGKGK